MIGSEATDVVEENVDVSEEIANEYATSDIKKALDAVQNVHGVDRVKAIIVDMAKEIEGDK